MVRGDLKAYNLMPFIEEEFATKTVKVSPMKRKFLDAQVFQYLKKSLSQTALYTLSDEPKSAFHAMEKLTETHGMDDTTDMVEIDRKLSRLRFWPNFDQNWFVKDFNDLVERFVSHGVIHSDKYLVIAFLQRLEGIFSQVTPLAFFYNQLTAEKLETITLAKL